MILDQSGISGRLHDVMHEPAGWSLSLYPAAGEGGGGYSSGLARCPTTTRRGESANPARSIEEAARRARSRVRRYAVTNALNRLGTLTYAESERDPKAHREHLAEFFRNLRVVLGGRNFPYVWVPEWHPGGHGLHAHFAVGRFIGRALISDAWGRGFVSIKLLGDMPFGATPRDEARGAAGYLSKYVAKAFADRDVLGRHRYDVAQGFQPNKERLFAASREELLDLACERMRAKPSYLWLSDAVESWNRPPALWVSWA